MPATLAPRPTTITIQDQTPAGKVLHELLIKVLTNHIRAAVMIR